MKNNMKKYLGPLFLVLVFGLAMSANTMAATLHVGSGQTYSTIKAAIAAATDGDIISIEDAEHTEASGLLGIDVNKSLTIQGAGAQSTIVQAAASEDSTRVFNIRSGKTVTIKDMTIRHGKLTNAGYYGGGICNAGTLTLTNCAVSNNQSKGYAGGIHNAGTLTLANCTVSNTQTTGRYAVGGGICNYSNGILTLTNCTVSGNQTTGADADGGGIFTMGTATLTNCTIANNSADDASSEGGGINIFKGDIYIKNTIIANNTAGGDGNDLRRNGGTLTSNGYNIVEDSSYRSDGGNGEFNATGDITGEQASLNLSSTLEGNCGTQTLKITSGSVAIDAGDNTTANHGVDIPTVDIPTKDQRGADRNGVTDIGAYEYDGVLRGILQFDPASYTVNEDVGQVTVTVTRTCGSDDAVSVNYATSDGTATQPSDYTSASDSLNWSDGDDTSTFTVTINDDSTYEATSETINLTLSGVSGAELGTSSATITISGPNDPPPPTVTTQAVTDITTTTATGNGNITDLGVPDPTQHGVVWSTSTEPTTADSKTEKGQASATGAFTSSMTELSPNTGYYVRAYATNSAGTSYGDEVSFNTPPPSVSEVTVTLGDYAAGEETRYKIDLKTSAFGALTADKDYIYITFPAGTTVPASIVKANVTVNGISLNKDPIILIATGVVVYLQTPINIGKSENVSVVFSSSAGIANPETATSYALDVYTDKDSDAVSSGEYTITPTIFDSFSLTIAPLEIPACVGFNSVVVTAFDEHKNRKTDYTGKVYFTSNDDDATLPYKSDNPYQFQAGNQGRKSFTGSDFKFGTVGTQYITVHDVDTEIDVDKEDILARSTDITVNPGPLDHFELTGYDTTRDACDPPSSDITVTAYDCNDNKKTDYTGTVSFSSTDSNATLPNDYTFTTGTGDTFDNGEHTFSVPLKTIGEQTITVTDSAPEPDVTETTTIITVDPGDLDYFTITGHPTTTDACVAFTSDVTVTAYDCNDNVKTNYRGTISFGSSDSNATLPGSYTFVSGDNGSHTFAGSNFTLKTTGTKTITVTDGSVSKTSDNITVNPGVLDHFTLSGVPSPRDACETTTFSVTVTAYDCGDNVKTDYTGEVSFSSTDTKAVLPSNYTFTGNDNGEHIFTGLTLKTTGTQTITVADASDTTKKGSATSTVEPGDLDHFTLTDYSSTQDACDEFTVKVTAYDCNDNVKTDYTGTVSFSSTDGQAVLPDAYDFDMARSNGVFDVPPLTTVM